MHTFLYNFSIETAWNNPSQRLTSIHWNEESKLLNHPICERCIEKHCSTRANHPPFLHPSIDTKRKKYGKSPTVFTTESFNLFRLSHTLGQETPRKSSLSHTHISYISIFCPIAGKSRRGKEESLRLTREPRTAYLAEADHFRKFAELCNKLYSGLVARRDEGGG